MREENPRPPFAPRPRPGESPASELGKDRRGAELDGQPVTAVVGTREFQPFGDESLGAPEDGDRLLRDRRIGDPRGPDAGPGGQLDGVSREAPRSFLPAGRSWS